MRFDSALFSKIESIELLVGRHLCTYEFSKMMNYLIMCAEKFALWNGHHLMSTARDLNRSAVLAPEYASYSTSMV